MNSHRSQYLTSPMPFIAYVFVCLQYMFPWISPISRCFDSLFLLSLHFTQGSLPLAMLFFFKQSRLPEDFCGSLNL